MKILKLWPLKSNLTLITTLFSSRWPTMWLMTSSWELSITERCRLSHSPYPTVIRKGLARGCLLIRSLWNRHFMNGRLRQSPHTKPHPRMYAGVNLFAAVNDTQKRMLWFSAGGIIVFPHVVYSLTLLNNNQCSHPCVVPPGLFIAPRHCAAVSLIIGYPWVAGGETKYVALSDRHCCILGSAILIISCVVKVFGALSGHQPRNG